MCVGGWIPVDPLTLETAYPDVYAVGDVTSVGTPKAGVFSERQASVVAGQLIARLGRGPGATYDGKGICYIEFGHDRVARVEVTFVSGQRPNGQFDEPSELLLADKADFGTSRIRRWFDRAWTSYSGGLSEPRLAPDAARMQSADGYPAAVSPCMLGP